MAAVKFQENLILNFLQDGWHALMAQFLRKIGTNYVLKKLSGGRRIDD